MTAIVTMKTMKALMISETSKTWPLISNWPASTPPPRKTPTSGRMRPAEMAPMSAATAAPTTTATARSMKLPRSANSLNPLSMAAS